MKRATTAAAADGGGLDIREWIAAWKRRMWAEADLIYPPERTCPRCGLPIERGADHDAA